MYVLAASGDRNPVPIIVWSLVLIGLVIVGFLIAAWVRQKALDSNAGANPDPGSAFTLSDLRALHRQGKLSDEEFARARDAMVAALKNKASKPGPQTGDAKGSQGPKDSGPKNASE